jgi:hypothetical protein
MSIGGGSNKQKSSSSSTSDSQSLNAGSNIWGAQAPWLTDLFNKAGGLANSPSGSFDAGMLYSDMAAGENMNASSQLARSQYAADNMGAALGDASTALKGFLNPTGTDPLSKAYATQMGQQFNEQFLPGLTGNAALAGGLGGSRQQIGAALGSQRAMQSIGDFNASLYGQQQDRALTAAQGLGAVAGGYGEQANSYGNTAAGRLAVSQNNLNLGTYAQQLPWAQLQMYQGLLGSPIMQDLGGYTVSHGTQSGTGSGSGWNANAGWS